jgi:AcrR family transcriptional regulator
MVEINGAETRAAPGNATPAVDGRAVRWAGQRERRREEFIAAAVEAIRLRGPDVTVEAIARSVGVARTRIYRHFRDGAEIRIAVADRIAEMLMSVLAPPSNTTDGVPRVVFKNGAQLFVDWLSANRNLWAYLVRSSQVYESFRAGMISALASLFSPYLAAAGAAPDTDRRLAAALVGMGSSLVDEWTAQPTGRDTEALVDDISGWTWALVTSTLARYGRSIDPDRPLPTLSEFVSGSTSTARQDNS